jgi:hypothetical protein
MIKILESKLENNMKKQIKTILFSLTALIAVSAQAQTQKQNETNPDLFSQVTMTQDFVGSMLDQLSSSSVDRMSTSKDYSIAGPELQVRIKDKLSNFRNAISMIFSGSFTQMIKEYNETVQDKSLTGDKRKSRISALHGSITQLSKAVQASYQAQLKELFMIEDSIYISEIKHAHHNSNKRTCGNYLIFKNEQSSKNIPDNKEVAYTDDRVNPQVRVQIKNLLLRQCLSQTCYSNLFNDYASYFSQIQNSVNKPIEITLADGVNVTIAAMNDPASNVINAAMSAFQFSNEYTELPFTN